MRSIECLTAGLAAIAADDVDALSRMELREQLRLLLIAVNQLNAEVTRRVEAFDRRDLAVDDACRTTAAWLRAFGRLSGHDASGQVKRARLCRQLPALTAAAAAGEVSAEHLDRVVRLADRVGVDTVTIAEPILTAVASQCDPAQLAQACQRIVAHADPDGAQPDAGKDFNRRGITLSPYDGMVLIQGQLDPEGGAALATALDALMTPPGTDELRTPAQRRADALVDLARGALREGRLPTVGGVRPQVAVLLSPQNLLNPQNLARGGQRRADLPAGLGPQLAHLEWVGDIPDVVARRIACDADVWRVVLDPATGQPLNVGRTHRLVPPWIRKALHARDRGCRFPGCHTPAAWTDGHHLIPWAEGGPTDIDNLLLLCRFHHGLVHEGGWSVNVDAGSGAVTATRPDGRLYDIVIRGPSTIGQAA
jgi:hypothetical protein